MLFRSFKEWIYSKLGDDYKKYPTSYLLKKYGKAFKDEYIGKDNEDDDDESYVDNNSEKIVKTTLFKRNVRPKIKLENCPDVENLNDLIEIGKTNKFYKNIIVLYIYIS